MTENKHLITVDQFKKLARPTSRHIDDVEVLQFIRECEDVFIIPAIGLRTFKRLFDADLRADDITLLEGGEYTDNCDVLRKCAGLQRTLAYFVYAKMIMSDGGLLTRTGMMQHNDSYASRGNDKNRVRRYDEVMNIAEAYLSSCVAFRRNHEGNCCGRNEGSVRGTRLVVHSIGD